MTNPKDSTDGLGRRSFLLKAATSAVVATASGSVMAQYQNGADPILAAIEVHRTAVAAVKPILDTHSVLECELPHDKRQSRVDVWRKEIVETDDPRWIESERAIHNAFDAEADAACVLVSICPTTIAGVIALLRYANAVDKDGEAWPRELMSDDGTKTRSWHYFLIEVIAETLPGMVSA
jgi:hypothetical protein